MKVVGVIPARYASTRFPGKPLIDIKGKSMIMRVYESCISSTLLDDVIIATDDERIYDHLIANSAKVMMTNRNHLNGTERISEIAEAIKGDCIIINIQGDEPCINPQQIDELVGFMKENKSFKIATLAKEIKDEALLHNSNTVKVFFKNNLATDFIREIESTNPELNLGKHIGIYGYDKRTLLELVKLKPSLREIKHSLEQLRWMDNDYKIAVNWTNYESPSVDVPEDLMKVEAFMNRTDRNELL